MLSIDHRQEIRSGLNVILWTAPVVAALVLAASRADAFWVPAAMVAGLSLSGSV